MLDGFYQFLARLGYTHPIHPPLTHFPIALVVGGFLFLLGMYVLRRKDLQLTPNQCIGLALVFVFPTALFGVMDWLHRYRGVWLFEIKMKIILASVLTVLLILALVLNKRTNRDPRVMVPIYALSAATVILLGYYGGQLVFARTPETIPAAQAGAAAQPDQAAQPGQAANAEAVRQGRALFQQICASCHYGGGNSIVRELPIKGAPVLSDQQTFTAFLRQPVVTRNGQTFRLMRAFPATVISDQQAGQLYQYIVQQWGKP